jgi:hypothetical protein
MDSERIIYILEQNGIDEVEEIVSSENYFVVRFCYEFDNEEINAARAYSNDESQEEEGSTDWYSDWYTPYLYDIAKDNIQEVIEEICEEFDIEGEFKELESQKGEIDYMKGIAIFCQDSSEVDLDDILNDNIS